MSTDDNSQNVRVMTRVRPFNKRELEIAAKDKDKKPPKCVVKMRDNTCAIVDYTTDANGFEIEKEREAFTFDECFWSLPTTQAYMPGKKFADQEYVYERSGKLALRSILDGFNCCIFAYGQTGSGKTFSMLGEDTPELKGISLRFVDDLFKKIEEDRDVKAIKYVVEVVFFELYKENVRDLFNKKATAKNMDYTPPRVRQHPTKGVYVEGLMRKEVTTAEATKKFLHRGMSERAMAETAMNPTSSRSHAVFRIQVIQLDAIKSTQKVSTMNLVDLAGSERVKDSLVKGEALIEATMINKSLTTLRKVIDTLIDNSTIKNPKNHKLAPVRESILTWVLSDSLGGNSKTQMITAISPHAVNTEETLGTLRYALRAKAIVCNATVNEEKSTMMITHMRDEILALQQKLLDAKNAPNEGGAGGAPSAEILQEIEERKQELAKAEENQVQMQIMLDRAADEEAKLKVAVEKHRRERFAGAFRNAFLIKGQKKKQEESKIELESLLRANAELNDEVNISRKQIADLQTEVKDLHRKTDTEQTRFSKDLADKESSNISLRKQLAILTEEAVFLRNQSEGLFQKVEAANQARHDAELQLQRAQEEILSLNSTLEQTKQNHKSKEQSLEGEIAELKRQGEDFAKRKDKYKQLYLQSNAQADARSTIIESMRDDRQTFVDTIKNQQAFVAEQAHFTARLTDDRREAQARADELSARLQERDQTIRGVNEALREYQNAAAEFIYEKSASPHRDDNENKKMNSSSPSLRNSASPLSAARSRFVDPAGR